MLMERDSKAVNQNDIIVFDRLVKKNISNNFWTSKINDLYMLKLRNVKFRHPSLFHQRCC